MNAPPNERVTLPLDRRRRGPIACYLAPGVLWALADEDRDIASQEICGFVERD